MWLKASARMRSSSSGVSMASRRSKWPLAMSFAPSVSSWTGRVMRLARAAATKAEARIDSSVRAPMVKTRREIFGLRDL